MRTDHAISIGLLVLAGCAHSSNRPYPLSEPLQQQLGEIGVVAQPVDREDALRLPQSGWLADAGRAAFIGGALGAGGIAHGVPITAGWMGIPVGIVVGSIYGGVMWDDPQKAEETLRASVAELEIDREIPDRLVAFSRSHGYEMTHLRAGPQEATEHRSRAALARRDDVDTLVEIRNLTVFLSPAEFPAVNPRRRLALSARVRLIRTADETILDDRALSDDFGPALSLYEWTADHAARFGQEISHASGRIAERIVTDYFMLSPFPERVFADGLFKVDLRGLRPYEPRESARYPDSAYANLPPEFSFMAQPVGSLQPTMRWEAFDGADVTYDLEIWKSDHLGIDALAYRRTNLDEPTHTLETALEPSSAYFWSVRAHYSEDGRDRITAWSRRTLKLRLPVEILFGAFSLGTSMLRSPLLDDTFYVFTTPPASSSATAARSD